MEEELKKILDMLNSKDREMVILGATLFFSEEIKEVYRYSLPGSQQVTTLISQGKPLSRTYDYARVGNNEHYDLFFRKGNMALYKGWNYWIFQRLSVVPFNIRSHRVHVDLN